jgi:hypothetical protein
MGRMLNVHHQRMYVKKKIFGKLPKVMNAASEYVSEGKGMNAQ